MEMSAYKHGQFNWVDLMSKDKEQAKAFYVGLFGWDAKDDTDDDNNYIYTMFSIGGKSVAGLGQMNEQMRASGMPAVWNSYINVDDIDAVSARVEQAGGKVMMPKMQIFEAGAMAGFIDPQGAAFFTWQAQAHIGAERVNEDNTYTWNELMTPDVSASTTFYSAVFNWEVVQMGPPDQPYDTVKNDGDMNAGMMKLRGDQLKNVPPNWSVYFSVGDIDAACDKVKSLGGEVHVAPFEIGVGKMAVCHDDQGAWFNLMQPADS